MDITAHGYADLTGPQMYLLAISAICIHHTYVYGIITKLVLMLRNRYIQQ